MNDGECDPVVLLLLLIRSNVAELADWDVEPEFQALLLSQKVGIVLVLAGRELVPARLRLAHVPPALRLLQLAVPAESVT